MRMCCALMRIFKPRNRVRVMVSIGVKVRVRIMFGLRLGTGLGYSPQCLHFTVTKPIDSLIICGHH